MTASKRVFSLGSWSVAMERYIPTGGFFVNIGANDGVSNDPIYPFIEKFDLSGIAVEPVPFMFRRLVENMRAFPSVTCERLAIAPETAPGVIYHMPERFEKERGYGDQIGSLSKERVGDTLDRVRLISRSARSPGQDDIVASDVQRMTFDDLMRKHSVDRVDIINLDAEALDFDILCSLDLARWKPSVLCIESIPFTQRQRREMFRRLTDLGYAFLMPLDIFSEVYVLPQRGRKPREPLTRRLTRADRARLLRRPHTIDDVQFVSSKLDKSYAELIRREERSRPALGSKTFVDGKTPPPFAQPMFNRSLTGEASTSPWKHVTRYGPFHRAGLLGAPGAAHAYRWLRDGVVELLDVFDLSSELLERCMEEARAAGLGQRVKTVKVDLNLEGLAGGPYDLLFSHFYLSHVIELEWALACAASVLKPNALLALHEYTGERLQHDGRSDNEPLREVLTVVPEDALRPVPPQSPMQGCRAHEIVPLARDRFQLLHQGEAGAAAPTLDRLAPEASEHLDDDEDPALVRALERAEREAGTITYALFRNGPRT